MFERLLAAGGPTARIVLATAVSALLATGPGNAASPKVLTTLGDSITEGDYGFTYTKPLAAMLGARLTNLALGGEFSGPVDYQLPPNVGSVHLVYGGVLADQVPKIPANATIVTLYVGTNDAYVSNVAVLPDWSNAIALAQIAAATYAKNIPPIVAGIKAKAPHARILVATMPNPAWRPINLTENVIGRKASTLFTSSVKATLVATGLEVIDLMCDPAMYDDANFGDPTAAPFARQLDVHPNKSGFNAIAAAFAAQIRHPSRVKHCKYESV